MALKDFYVNTSKNFTVNILYNSQTPDISADAVWFYMKKKLSDANTAAILSSSADVATSGNAGTALFTLSPTQTTVTAANYVYELTWITGSEEYVIDQANVNVKERVWKP